MGGVRRADDGYAEVCSNGVREAHAVADHRAGFGGAEAEVQLVFRGRWGVAYFCCFQIPLSIVSRVDLAMVRGRWGWGCATA